MLVFDPPRRHSANHILAEIYHRCRALKIELWVDYKITNPWGRKFKVNAAVVRDKQVICFVWVRNSYNAARNMTKKKHRLERTEVPLVIVRSMARVPAAMEDIKRYWRGEELVQERGEALEASSEVFGGDVVGAWR